MDIQKNQKTSAKSNAPQNEKTERNKTIVTLVPVVAAVAAAVTFLAFAPRDIAESANTDWSQDAPATQIVETVAVDKSYAGIKNFAELVDDPGSEPQSTSAPVSLYSVALEPPSTLDGATEPDGLPEDGEVEDVSDAEESDSAQEVILEQMDYDTSTASDELEASPVDDSNIEESNSVDEAVLETVAATEGVSLAASTDLERIHTLEHCRLSAYCSCELCCGVYAYNRPVDEYGNEIIYGSWGRCYSGATLAVNPDEIPYGSYVYIQNAQTGVWDEFRATDTGGGIVNYSRTTGPIVDIFYSDHYTALHHPHEAFQTIYWSAEPIDTSVLPLQ